jgi:hypothetical protein
MWQGQFSERETIASKRCGDVTRLQQFDKIRVSGAS